MPVRAIAALKRSVENENQWFGAMACRGMARVTKIDKPIQATFGRFDDRGGAFGGHGHAMVIVYDEIGLGYNVDAGLGGEYGAPFLDAKNSDGSRIHHVEQAD